MKIRDGVAEVAKWPPVADFSSPLGQSPPFAPSACSEEHR